MSDQRDPQLDETSAVSSLPSSAAEPAPEATAAAATSDKVIEANAANTAASQQTAAAVESSPTTGLVAELNGFVHGFFQIRNRPGLLGRGFMALLCLAVVGGVWFVATREIWGPAGNERALNSMTLGSPEEVFGSFGSLWFDRALMRNLLASMWRVLQGFGLALIVGVPLGILCGSFRRIDAFFAPVSLFGRNVPIAALVPLTMLFFGIGEAQKIAFIFVACVAFVIFDASRAVADVSDDYLDTAFTLGASRWQVLTKVIIPLAAPDIFNSARLLFGLAFGYIVLAEMVNAEFGVGKLILVSQRRGPKEHVYLILLFLTVVAFLLDRALYAAQRRLFAYRYGRR